MGEGVSSGLGALVNPHHPDRLMMTGLEVGQDTCNSQTGREDKLMLCPP